MKKTEKFPDDSYVKGLDGKQNHKNHKRASRRKQEVGRRLLDWQIKKQKYDKPNSEGGKKKICENDENKKLYTVKNWQTIGSVKARSLLLYSAM